MARSAHPGIYESIARLIFWLEGWAGIWTEHAQFLLASLTRCGVCPLAGRTVTQGAEAWSLTSSLLPSHRPAMSPAPDGRLGAAGNILQYRFHRQYLDSAKFTKLKLEF